MFFKCTYLLVAILLQFSKVECDLAPKSFVKVTSYNGTDLCAGDKPSAVFIGRNSLLNSATLPASIQCAWSCTQESNCTSFNYRTTTQMCELYFYTPNNCTYQPGCEHLEVKGLVSCCRASGSQVGPIYSSCRAILAANNNASNGIYTIINETNLCTYQVYCVMTIRGGGYTVLSPSTLAVLTDSELQAMYADTTAIIMFVNHTNATQSYGVLKQLQPYSGVPLMLGLNQNVGYNTPNNVNNLGGNYLYLGVINISSIQPQRTYGLNVNGMNITYNQCDSNANNMIVQFPNLQHNTPSTSAFTTSYPFANSLFGATVVSPAGFIIPLEYFMFTEVAFGGCGCYSQTDNRPVLPGILGTAFGFR